ncbi:hypothetical protein FMM79_01230 [Novosphingobium sp. BW1]|nr:hypothetical protein FMM79_01230 [Novosphingobium sp. BW1]
MRRPSGSSPRARIQGRPCPRSGRQASSRRATDPGELRACPCWARHRPVSRPPGARRPRRARRGGPSRRGHCWMEHSLQRS